MNYLKRFIKVLLIYIIIMLVTFCNNLSICFALSQGDYYTNVSEPVYYDRSGYRVGNGRTNEPILGRFTDYLRYSSNNYFAYTSIEGLRISIVDRSGNLYPGSKSVDVIGNKSYTICDDGNCSDFEMAHFSPNDNATLYETRYKGLYTTESIENLEYLANETKQVSTSCSRFTSSSSCSKAGGTYKKSGSKCNGTVIKRQNGEYCTTGWIDTYSCTGKCTKTVYVYPDYHALTGNSEGLCNLFSKKSVAVNRAKSISTEVFSWQRASRRYCNAYYTTEITKGTSFTKTSEGYVRIGSALKAVSNGQSTSTTKDKINNPSEYLKNNTSVYYWSELSGINSPQKINNFAYNNMYNNLGKQSSVYKLFDLMEINDINILDQESYKDYYIIFEPLLYVRALKRKGNAFADSQYIYYGTISDVHDAMVTDGIPGFKSSSRLSTMWNNFRLYSSLSIGNIKGLNGSSSSICSSVGFSNALGSSVKSCGSGVFSLLEIFWKRSFACHYEVSINGSTSCETSNSSGYTSDSVSSGTGKSISDLESQIKNQWSCIVESKKTYGSDFYYDKKLSYNKCDVYCLESVNYEFPNSINAVNAGTKITINDYKTGTSSISPVSIYGKRVCKATGSCNMSTIVSRANANNYYNDFNPKLEITFNNINISNNSTKYKTNYNLFGIESKNVSVNSDLITITKNINYVLDSDKGTGQYYHYVCKNGVSYDNPKDKTSCKYLGYSNVPVSFDTPKGTYNYKITMTNLFGKNQKFYGIINKGSIAGFTSETESLGSYLSSYKSLFVPDKNNSAYLTREFITGITARKSTALEELKQTSCYSFYNCSENAGMIKCDYNAKSSTNTNSRVLYENFYYCLVNIKSILTNVNRTVTGGNDFGTYACKYKVVNQFKEKNSIIYRPISLTDPFPGENGESRTPGTNWNDESIIESVIKSARGTSSDTPYELYTKEPIYEFVLTPSNISNIRKYNNNNEYTDFDLQCGLDSSNKSTGEKCISNFIKDGISNGYFKDASGTCYGVLSSKLSTCKGG